MSKNKKYTSLAGHLKRKDEALDRFQKSHHIGRHRTVMFEDSVQVLNQTGQSTTTWTDLDISGATGISTKAIIGIFKCKIKDSGSAATQIVLQLRVKGSSDADGTSVLYGSHINNQYNGGPAIVGLDGDLTLQYAYTASGAGTLDVLIYLIGYIEKL